MKRKTNGGVIFVIVFIFIFFALPIVSSIISVYNEFANDESRYFKILSSTENKDIEQHILDYAKKHNIKLKIDYAGNLDIIDKINMGTNTYNAVWVSNSMWYYMLNNPSVVKNAKSISINPVVFGIKKSIATKLGFVDKEIYTKDILQAIKNKELGFVMTSPIRTNTGATAYLGFLSTLLDKPEIITTSMLERETLRNDMINLFSGVERVSGSEEFLEDMFLNGDYQSVVSYETSLININKKLIASGKEPLYLVYPEDGVALNDSSFGYIETSENQSVTFKEIQDYLLSKNFQDKLIKTGRRVWYGGINKKAPKDIFNPEWGIDTTKYLTAVRFPSKDIIREALALYQSELRKPSHTVFLLDYSGSMYGNGITQLSEAMDFILTEDKAKQNLVQFSRKDKITIIPFSSDVITTWHVTSGKYTNELLTKVKNQMVGGSTNIYDPSIKALEILSKENLQDYNVSIVLMTDGESNRGTYYSLENSYNQYETRVPIYSITFGDSNESQLRSIAGLTNGKVFDGKTNLLEAFKEVRGYN